jgi:hypothetical protein
VLDMQGLMSAALQAAHLPRPGARLTSTFANE